MKQIQSKIVKEVAIEVLQYFLKYTSEGTRSRIPEDLKDEFEAEVTRFKHHLESMMRIKKIDLIDAIKQIYSNENVENDVLTLYAIAGYDILSKTGTK